MTIRRWGRIAATGLIVATSGLTVTGPPAPARASGETGEPGDRDAASPGVDLRVEAGIGGQVAPDRPYPVQVTITTDRLIEGVVQVEVPAAGGSVTLERPVEVTGGATARYLLLAPPAVGGPLGLAPVRGRLSGSGVAAEGHADIISDPGKELVGVLPELAGPAGSLRETVPLVVDAGVAELVPLDPELLDAGPLALEPLDQLVATSDELVSLGPDARHALLTWVDGGGQLLLRGDVPPPEVLPAGWRPEPGGAQRAGLGQVRSVGDDWQRSLAPSPTRSVAEEEIIASDLGNVAAQPMAARLGREAGLELPEGRALGLLLAGYVLVMGPVAYLVVRRVRRRELAWAGLPLLALASTVVVFGTGSSLRNALRTAQVTVYEVSPAGAVATTWSLVPSARGGDVGVELPPGWTGGSNPVDTPGGGRRLTTDGGAGRLVEAVDPGGFALLETRGPAAGLTAALEVTARSEVDGEIRGTVHNQLDVPLTSVAVFTGRARAVEVGRLGPGEARDFHIEDATRFEWGATPESHVWPPDSMPFEEVVVSVDDGLGVVSGSDPGGGDRIDESGREAPVVLSAWQQTLRRTGTNYRPSGQVVAVGWTDELVAPTTPIDQQVGRSTSAVVARATAVPAGSRLTDTATVKSIVRGPLTQPPADTPEAAAANGIGIIHAFDLPDLVGDRPVDVDRLVINPADLFVTFDIWTPQGWVPIDPPDVGQEEHRVPPEAVIDGTVHVRSTVPTNAIPNPGRDLVIYEREGP